MMRDLAWDELVFEKCQVLIVEYSLNELSKECTNSVKHEMIKTKQNNRQIAFHPL